MQLLPQARQFAQFVLLQPGLHLALGLHAFLQLLQGIQARFQLRIGGGFGIDLRLRRAALLFQLRLLFLGFFQQMLRLFQRHLLFFQLFLQVGQMRAVRHAHAIFFLRQPLAPHRQAGQDIGSIALVRRFQLDLLLDLHDLAARLGGFQLRLAPGLLQRRQRLVLLLRGHLRLLDARGLLFQHQLGFGQFFLVLAALALPLVALGGERIQLRLQAAARLDHELDLRFQAADLGIGLVQVPLGLVQAVAGGVMRLAHLFELQLDMAQLGGLLFQVGLGLFDIAKDLFLLGLRFILAQQPQQLLFFFLVGLQCVELARHFRLAFQLFQVGVQFAQDVFHAREVFAGVVQAVFGFAAAFLVFGDAGGFFQEDAQLFRARLDDARDHALADDGVGARAQAGAEENILDVAAAHRLVIDVVSRGAVARQGALDGDFGELAPLAGSLAVGIVEHQFHRGAAGRLAMRGTVEDHVLHRFAAQFGRLGLAQHPARGIDDVGFAAAVGADHADQLTRHLEVGGIDEGFETR